MTGSAILHVGQTRQLGPESAIVESDNRLPSMVAFSPSLEGRASRNAPAREIKFLLAEDQARRVEAELCGLFVPDPHAISGQQPGQYVTTTVYCDTPEFDVYYRRQAHGRRKFRLRRYDFSDTVYLERKVKEGTRVLKRRTGIPIVETHRLNHRGIETDWCGDWFRRRLWFRSLSPKMEVMYSRTAYVGWGDYGPLRLTFDRSIQARRIDHWHAAPFHGGSAVLADRVVCEFKFRGAVPTAFKAVMESEQLCPGSASKYRLGVEAVGLALPSGVLHA